MSCSTKHVRCPYGGTLEGCSRGIDRETSNLTDQLRGCATIPTPTVMYASNTAFSPPPKIHSGGTGTPRPPGSEVHIIDLFNFFPQEYSTFFNLAKRDVARFLFFFFLGMGYRSTSWRRYRTSPTVVGAKGSEIWRGNL